MSLFKSHPPIAFTIYIYVNHCEIGLICTNLPNYGAPPCRWPIAQKYHQQSPATTTHLHFLVINQQQQLNHQLWRYPTHIRFTCFNLQYCRSNVIGLRLKPLFGLVHSSTHDLLTNIIQLYPLKWSHQLKKTCENHNFAHPPFIPINHHASTIYPKMADKYYTQYNPSITDD